MDEIFYWASQFRSGIENAKKNGFLSLCPFYDFPNACCGETPELLAQYLMENFDENCKYKYVYGVYRYDDFDNIFGHAWLEVDNSLIVDITADQRQFRNPKIFPQNAFVPCFAGVLSEFHELFEIESRQCFEILKNRCLDDSTKERYNTIVSQIKGGM